MQTRRVILAALALVVSSLAQQARMPDVAAQRAAMKKLGFLVGKWSGEGRSYRAAGESEFLQTENAQYKLDGLLLTIEGVGKSKDGKTILKAFGVISYDDAAGTYRFRAFNDGRWLETDVKLTEDGRGLTWGFTLGDIKTSSVLGMNEKGEWTEAHNVTVGTQPKKRFMEIVVRPVK